MRAVIAFIVTLCLTAYVWAADTTLRVKLGLETNLPALSTGEPAFTTDSKKFFIGSDSGNVEFAKTAELPAAQIKSDWNASGTLAEILNKPVIFEVCGADPETAIFDGAPALSCAIDSGSLAFVYDGSGSNPEPEMLPYTVKLYEVGLNNNQPLADNEFTVEWSVADNSLIFGNATTHSFTPTILGNYSAGRTNWIKAVLTKGLKTCIAMVPISATKEGNTGPTGATGPQGEQGIQGVQGIQGPPGDSPTITKAAVQGEFTMNNPGGTAVYLRPNSSTGQTDNTDLLVAGDTAGNERLNVTANKTTISTFASYSGYTGYSGNVLTVDKKYQAITVPLTNAWSERFTAIRSDNTVAVTAGKTYTETISVYANGTITAASINFRTPNGDHIVPAYISTASSPATYTLTATYTTETGGTSIRMPDITYLAGTATSISVTGASLVQQKTNLNTAANFAALYLWTAGGNVSSVLQADGSRTITRAEGFASTSVNGGMVSVANGITYQTSIIASLTFTGDTNYTTGRGTVSSSSATSVSLGSHSRTTFSAFTATTADISKMVPNSYGHSGTSINIIDVTMIDTAETAPPTTNLYSGSLANLYHYTAAHTTASTYSVITVTGFAVRHDGGIVGPLVIY